MSAIFKFDFQKRKQQQDSYQRETILDKFVFFGGGCICFCFVFLIGKAKKSIGWAKYMYVCEWYMCWRNFCNFPWWLKDVKSRSKIALFSNERHFEIWFPKKKTITFFWSKLSKLHKTRPNFVCDNYIFPKTREKNKQCTHSTPLKNRLDC